MVLVGLAPYLSAPLLSDVLKAALEAARTIRDAEERVRALVTLVPCLPAPLKAEVLREVLETAWALPEVLVSLVPHLTALFPANLYQLWRETLHRLATCTREDAMPRLCALSPILIALGGTEAVVETACAILDVGRWWP
jgi:hypothetical protein